MNKGKKKLVTHITEKMGLSSSELAWFFDTCYFLFRPNLIVELKEAMDDPVLLLPPSRFLNRSLSSCNFAFRSERQMLDTGLRAGKMCDRNSKWGSILRQNPDV